jgi:hypothetical protein
LNTRSYSFGFVESARVDIGDADYFSVRNSDYLLEKFLTARTNSDHRHADTIVSAKGARSEFGRKECGACSGSFLEEVTASVLDHANS